MFFRKTQAVVVMAIIFIGSTGLVQGYAPINGDKASIAVSSSNSTSKSATSITTKNTTSTNKTSSTTKSTTKKIVLDHNEITIVAGQTIQLKAQIMSAAKEVTGNSKLVWKSSNSASVKVTGQGNIKAIKPNSKAVITVSSADKKFTASCQITVMSEQEAMGCVAIINNLKVTNQEYIVFSKYNMNQFLLNNNINVTADKYNWTTKINGKTAKELVKKKILDDIQEFKIQLTKAKDTGIKLNTNDIKSIDDNFNQFIKINGSREAAEKSIKATYGISLSEYQNFYTDLVLTQKYINSELSKATISDSEVKKYYDNHRNDYAKVNVSHILISTVGSDGETVSADKKAEAKKKAEGLLVRVNAGEDINALAEQNSEDPGVKVNKGEYTFGKGEMVAQFEEWAFSHSVGDTGIVETSYGYHVMKLKKRIETPYDDVKNNIKAILVEAKFNSDFQKKMDSWKKESMFGIIINEKTIEKRDKSLYRI